MKKETKEVIIDFFAMEAAEELVYELKKGIKEIFNTEQEDGQYYKWVIRDSNLPDEEEYQFNKEILTELRDTLDKFLPLIK